MELVEQHLFPGSGQLRLPILHAGGPGGDGRPFLRVGEQVLAAPVVALDLRHRRVAADCVALEFSGDRR